MDRTDRLGLPLLSAGQIQKELFHNESLLTLDLLVGGRLAPEPSATPPSTAEAGIWHRIDHSPTGDWAGQGGDIAAMTAGGWRFLTPFAGLVLRDQATGEDWTFDGAEWAGGVVRASEVRVGNLKVVGERGDGIAGPAGGSVVDAESRLAIESILGALRAHGLIGN